MLALDDRLRLRFLSVDRYTSCLSGQHKCGTSATFTSMHVSLIATRTKDRPKPKMRTRFRPVRALLLNTKVKAVSCMIEPRMVGTLVASSGVLGCCPVLHPGCCPVLHPECCPVLLPECCPVLLPGCCPVHTSWSVALRPHNLSSGTKAIEKHFGSDTWKAAVTHKENHSQRRITRSGELFTSIGQAFDPECPVGRICRHC